MRLILIRHGQTASNVGGQLDTAIPGAPLTELGQAQADAVVPALEARGERVAGIIASPLLRTQQTAAPLSRATDLPVRLIEGLREIEAGHYEMRSDPEAVAGYIGVAFGWENDRSLRMPGSCSGDEFVERYDAAIAEGARAVFGADAEHRDGDSAPRPSAPGTPALVVFSHGAAIWAWVGLRADNVDLSYAAEHWLPNTGMVALTGDPFDREAPWHVEEWVVEPLGGLQLTDRAYHDPTGEPEDEAIREAGQPVEGGADRR